MLLVILSASVEIYSVVRLRDFHQLGPLGRVGLVAMAVRLSLCPSQIFSRPFIGPQVI